MSYSANKPFRISYFVIRDFGLTPDLPLKSMRNEVTFCSTRYTPPSNSYVIIMMLAWLRVSCSVCLIELILLSQIKVGVFFFDSNFWHLKYMLEAASTNIFLDIDLMAVITVI